MANIYLKIILNMRNILEYIKFLFCKHSKDIFVRNIYGDFR